jgi:large subunit ribosomal protein L20
MARVKGGTAARARRKSILKEAKGYFGSKHRLFKTAKEQVQHSGVYAFRDRRQKKRDFRKLWITRINAACRENDISYSKFMNGLSKAGLAVNRKMLSEIAIDNSESFKDLVVIAKDALEGKTYKPAKVTIKAETKKEVKEEVKAEDFKEEFKEELEKKATTKKATTKKSEEKPVKETATKKITTKKATK